MSRISVWILVQLFCLILRADAQIKADDGPTESECRPYIEKALHELHPLSADATNGSPEGNNLSDQISSENSPDNDSKNSAESQENNEVGVDTTKSEETETAETQEGSVENLEENPVQTEDDNEQDASNEKQASVEDDSTQQENESDGKDTKSEDDASNENEATNESTEANEVDGESGENGSQDTPDDGDKSQVVESAETEFQKEDDSKEDKDDTKSSELKTSSQEKDNNESVEKDNDDSTEQKSDDETTEDDNDETKSEENASVDEETISKEKASVVEASNDSKELDDTNEDTKTSSAEKDDDSPDSKEETTEDPSSKEAEDKSEKSGESDGEEDEDEKASDEQNDEPDTEIPEDELLSAEVSLHELRNRSHISEILNLDNESKDKIINSVAEIILRDLRRIYENSIKPLEMLYKYRELSNRHFSDSEIFSKPLILLMGPWSAGKSSIINYLTDNENTEYSLRSGAEPSPAYFNLVMYGDEPEVMDGTQLVADHTFSGLQKFGQGLEERLHGLKLPNKLLKKVNIVEIPGILEVRKQVSRQFPFNDACQWFIDRADMIFLVYDPSKLDVGQETEAILDQLKGREYQTRIILNKADRVKPDELLRVQSALMWNISPLMSSTQPPVMYTVSLWSRVFESGAPTRLLQAQENALLKDIRLAIDKRIEHKIASARRFAVRVRNHAKMVDCYLTTYYNHKSLFGNKKRIADQIIENPHNYHIYEGLSTLTNISRYDLPDPEIYREFFHLNPLFEFKKLAETCTYFRGCPINKLDVAIAYDLPDLVGKYKREIDSAFAKTEIPGSS